MDSRDYIVFIICTIILLGFAWFVLAVLFNIPAHRPKNVDDSLPAKAPRPQTLRDMQIHTHGGGRPQNDPQTTARNVLALLPDGNTLTIDQNEFDRLVTGTITSDRISAREIPLQRLTLTQRGWELSSPSRADKVGETE